MQFMHVKCIKRSSVYTVAGEGRAAGLGSWVRDAKLGRSIASRGTAFGSSWVRICRSMRICLFASCSGWWPVFSDTCED